MKINTSSIFSCLPPLLIAVVVSVATPSFAMPQMGDQGETMHLQLRQLHDSLKLTEQQELLWKRAATESHDKMKLRQAEHQQAIGEVKAVLNDPQADLRALSGKMDARREMAEKESKETRELWLSVYDSLDVKQREMARRFLLERVEHMEKTMSHMKHHGHELDAAHDTNMPQ